jgi:hypothetical protein
MDHSFQVGAGGWAGRVEGAGEERGRLRPVEQPQRDLGGPQELGRLGGTPCEGCLGGRPAALWASQDEQDPAAQERGLPLAETAEETRVLGGGGASRGLETVRTPLERGCVALEARRFALDHDLERVARPVEVAAEGGDEGGLLVGSA